MSKLLEPKEYRKFTAKSELDKALSTLNGLLSGITIDNKVDDLEVQELINWCVAHQEFRKKQPFKDIIDIIQTSAEDGVITSEEFKDIVWVVDKCTIGNGYYDVQTKALQILQGVLHGIVGNNIISDEEIHALMNWLEGSDFLKGLYPYDEVYSLVVSVLEDGIITDDERNILKAYFSNFIETEYSLNIDPSEVEKLRQDYTVDGICAVDPIVTFENKVFCFTGASDKFTRKELKEIVEGIGADFTNTLTKKVDYLVIGTKGSPCWAYSCYGRKIEQATTLRKDGHPVQLVHENDFWDSYQNFM